MMPVKSELQCNDCERMGGTDDSEQCGRTPPLRECNDSQDYGACGKHRRVRAMLRGRWAVDVVPQAMKRFNFFDRMVTEFIFVKHRNIYV